MRTFILALLFSFAWLVGCSDNARVTRDGGSLDSGDLSVDTPAMDSMRADLTGDTPGTDSADNSHTYYVREDGTATQADARADKGGGCSSESTAMSVTMHNSATFNPGDVIYLCSTGGNYESTRIVPPSAGTETLPIVYDGYEEGDCAPATSDDCPGAAVIGASEEDFLIVKDWVTIRDVWFSGGGGYPQLLIGSQRAPLPTVGTKVLSCRFGSSTWSAVIAYSVEDFVFDKNKIANSSAEGTGQNITIVQAERAFVSNNRFEGGMTSLIFKYTYTDVPDIKDAAVKDSVIYNNTAIGRREEGLSFDSFSNNFEYDTVSSVSGTSIALSDSGWGGDNDPDYVGFYIIPVTGAAKGQYRRIVKQDGASFTVEGSFNGLSKSDGVTIGAPYVNNTFARNDVQTGNWSEDRIHLYNLSVGNFIMKNQTNGGGIKIKSIDRNYAHPGSVTGAAGRGPAGMNWVDDNICGWVTIQYRCQDYAGGYTPYETYGNTVTNNVMTNGLRRFHVNYQNYYATGNSGDGSELNEFCDSDCSNGYSDCNDTVGNPMPSYRTCSDGKITANCTCGGVVYPAGYCCSSSWQALSCS